ncbi:conserved hypothetical protein [Histoplasma capsulatum G186AR]|uniref:Uncharacterized protein n=2 Tax=Ajellomyces capsulatus TaxID=5037 RepID=C0NF30_AJECG|nr:uncharacterized protein HCBG_01496 [Histoplasma capsulatum G186AR]EEH09851.1 conserved hypothetical protein [Histoplasma capsulatum G186AR]KAG5298873.1 ADP-ribosylation factor [Histoplasma capsulatum]QSS73134.1 ADP-ribosylation factor [Histoplasma capsulatum G186AR]
MEADGSEDVNDFLNRIRELGNKRDREDEERTRKLEEEIIQGRREREARRAERARSISPTKDSPGPYGSPSLAGSVSHSSPVRAQSIEPPLALLPSPKREISDTTPATEEMGDSDMAKADDLARHSARLSTSSRPSSRGLTWQQRPGSRDLDAGIVPFPTFPSPKSAVETRLESTSALDADSTPPRSHIAQSLASKDPTWFRQTSDRGIGSPAYRRAQDSSVSDVSMLSGNIRLPGFSRDPTVDSEKVINNDHTTDRSGSPSRASSTYATGSSGNRYSSVSSVVTAGGLGSPVPLSNSQRIESRASFTANDPHPADRFAMSPSQGRIAADRSSSPTKGLGGFVQSAMMKRSDSVSKRWSNQQTGRGTAVPKPGYQTPPSSLFREASDETSHISSSRPGSSHTETTIVRQHTKGELEPSKSPNDVALKQSLPSRPLSRSDSISNVGDRPSDLPVSPSKTMDSRRWSPTKATWLESALNKPDSPKLKPQFQEEPEWKKGLNNRLRQSKASVDLGRPGSPKFSLQKENQPPTGISTQSLRESENRDSANTVKSSHPKLRSALQSDNEVLRIDTMASVAQTAEYPKKLDDLRSRPIASPRQMADSPASPSPIGSQKGLGSITKSPVDGISPQLKPSTPPLNNFRANLRRREITDGASNKDEPEFKNVFGKLRKTETKNYVAPDLLKDNILRGKAGLNATGGPKKSDKIDEFKESILKQKEAMKTGGGSIRRPTIGDKGAISPDKSSLEIPEAITRQRTMTKSGPAVTSLLGNGRHLKPAELPKTVGVQREIKQSEAAESDVQDPELEAIPSKTSSIHGPEGEASDIVTYARNLPSDKLADIPAKPDQQPDVSLQQSAAKLHNNREIPEQSSKLAGIASKYDQSSIQTPPNGPRARSGTGKLADRLNPALAGLLSRGPPSSSGPPSGSNDKSSRPMPSQSELSESILPAKLTHTTKGRAKGPKRRLPQSGTSDQKPQKNEHKTPLKVELTTSWSLRDTNPSDDKLSQDTSPTKEDVRSLLKGLPPSKKESDTANASFTPNGLQRKDKPSVSSKSPDLRQFTPTNNGPKRNDSEYDGTDTKLELLSSKKYAQIDTLPPTPIARRSTSNESFKSDGKPSPPPKPTTISTTNSSLSQKSLPPFPQERINSPPVPPKAAGPTLNKQQSPSIGPKTSPFPESSEAINIFSSFFDTMPKASDKVEVDPQSILMSQPDVYPKINTISKQIWEITGDGKRKDLPANQGYILFEQSMYLCVHVFEEAGGPKTTQVHLWCGDEVAEAAIEDAQLFARKVARENSCKLELVKQGKEAPTLIQALGGIIITRRGSGSRANSSSMYMLCGRRHMGQIAFDEVDLTSKSLCSGYPYLISAKFGKLYLWQGRGSTADELGCARLIGMDLGLTGEIEEVIEGKEPPGFFETFPDTFQPTPAQTADHWKLKPTNGKYCCRLYRVDHELGQRFGSGFWGRRGTTSPVTRPNDVVQEIEPFCQRDLDPNHIHILDTFFEIFVIVGDRANARSAEFASALIFAQEYGIMAVSLQDRPFLPKSSVVIYGLSEECKRAFRKWDDRGILSPRKTPSVFPLNAAIEAIR